MNGWLIFALLLAGYLGIYLILRQRTQPLPGGFEFTGPLLLWRTQFGKRTIEKVSRPHRLWNAVADVGIVVTWIIGLAIFALLLVSLWQYLTAPREVAQTAPPLQFLVGLPGINPLIPVGYGILALILALVIHEGSHGVMAYVAKMRVKSLGLVFFILPIGAFVEPHDEDLMRATTRQKNRVFAAGPMSNIVLALVAGLLLSGLFVGQMAPVNDGEGIVVAGIEQGSAAELAGLQPRDALTAINGEPILGRASYSAAMANSSAGDRVDIAYIRDGEPRTTTAVLGDRYEYLRRVAPELEGQPNGYNESQKGVGFLGIGSVELGGGVTRDDFGVGGMRDALANPFRSVPAFFFYLSYPFFIFTQGIDVMNGPWTDLFVIEGPLAGLPEPVFFGAATFLYWVVWLNLMLGTFNALPAGPLDGGQMFRATLADRLMRRYRVDRDQLEVERLEMGGLQLRGKDPETQSKLDRVNATLSRTTRTLGFFILGLILLPVVAAPIIRLLF